MAIDDGFDDNLELDEELVAKQLADEANVVKQEKLKNLMIEVDGIKFDATINGQSNMASVGTIANWQYNLKIIEYMTSIPDPSPELVGFLQISSGVYDALYRQTTVQWKAEDGKLYDLSIEKILAGLHLAMLAKATILHDSVV